jgi:hypothetical protein
MWLEEQVETTERPVDDKWLKIPEPALGKTTEVRLRILDEEPVGIWRHWQNGRAYNCPGIGVCPVCKVRMEAKKYDPEGYKNNFRMDYRYYFNVFVDGKVRIWSFSSGVGRKLKVFLEKYGDLRDYDISVRKRKTGPQVMNVEYDVIYEEKSALSVEDSALVETKYDLSPFIQPTPQEVLISISKGESPLPTEPTAAPAVATKADMIVLTSLIKAKGFELSHFGIVDGTALPKTVVAKLIEDLKSEK